MKNIENTVPASDQMINSSEVSFLGDNKAPVRVLVFGNSITRHAPKAEIGWYGDYGMAASCAEKDYVHRLYAKLTESGREVYMRVRQTAAWELEFMAGDYFSRFDGEKDFGADIIIFRLGENVKSAEFPYFCEAAKDLIDYVNSKCGKVLITTCFWRNEVLDEAIKELADANSYALVDIGCLDDSLMALGLFEHSGVAAHPGDEGMEFIANKIFESL
jgi:hypothetical protein